MANVILDDTHLTNIANAIREKNGEATTYTPGAMAKAITDLPSGGGSVEVEPIVLTMSCDYACSGLIASAYIELFGDTISTDSITSASHMFDKYQGEYIPFDINFNSNYNLSMNYMFNSAAQLKELPVVIGAYPMSLNNIFAGDLCLNNIPENYFDDWDFSYMQSNNFCGGNYMFFNCYSLRAIPQYMLKNMWCKSTSSSYVFYNCAFGNCYVLDEINGLAVQPGILTSNCFSSAFQCCHRLKTLLFETNEDGTAKTAEWKNQTIDLTQDVGYLPGSYLFNSRIGKYNSGITSDKIIASDETYAALKDDVDATPSEPQWSRYNYWSAKATINSLPDTSAYLATQSRATNTIKFEGLNGLNTGKAIQALSTSEIAVATAKGWTVSLV